MIFDREAGVWCCRCRECEERFDAPAKKEACSMFRTLHPMLQVMVALFALAILIWPGVLVNDIDLNGDDSDRTRIR